jgi:guanylate kinase
MQSATKNCIIFIVSAPSGTGKTSLCNGVIRQIPRLTFSVSHTTRPPRPGEKNGTDYYFVAPEVFKQYIAEHKMAEWTEIYGNCYGTSTETIERMFDSGCDMLLDVEERGARQLVDKYPACVTILVLPPSLDELKKRLRERGTDDPGSIARRLKQAQDEITAMSWYQYVVVNDRFDDAVAQLSSIIIAERCRRDHGLIQSIVDNGTRSKK